MRWWTHLAFAFLVALLFLNFLSMTKIKTVAFVLIALFMALVPDIDEEQSKLGKKIRPLSWMIEKIFRHRGIFHSIFPSLILFLLFFYLGLPFIAWAVIAGYLSHLLIDGFTLKGVNFLNPFLNLRLSGFIKTGSAAELILFGMLILVDVVMLLRIIF